MVVVEVAMEVLAGGAAVPLARDLRLQVPNPFPRVADARIPQKQRGVEGPLRCLNRACLPAGWLVVARG